MINSSRVTSSEQVFRLIKMYLANETNKRMHNCIVAKFYDIWSVVESCLIGNHTTSFLFLYHPTWTYYSNQSRLVFYLTLLFCVASREAANINCKFFGMRGQNCNPQSPQAKMLPWDHRESLKTRHKKTSLDSYLNWLGLTDLLPKALCPLQLLLLIKTWPHRNSTIELMWH